MIYVSPDGDDHWSGSRLYHWLKFELNFHTTGNKPLSLGNVYRTLSNPFYYGIFEFPKKSGNWYNGKHEPIISKELFDQVQSQMKSQVLRVENKPADRGIRHGHAVDAAGQPGPFLDDRLIDRQSGCAFLGGARPCQLLVARRGSRFDGRSADCSGNGGRFDDRCDDTTPHARRECPLVSTADTLSKPID